MSDLISRQDAIDAIHKSTEKYNYFMGMENYTDEDAVEAINTVPASQVISDVEWIPVTEALPINDADVIVSVLDDSGDTPYRFTSVGWCTPDGQYWVVNNEICYGVIAWMPLPEPYRGE